mgnify:CR=1 FL=1
MKVEITFSIFDLLHTGHIKILEEAKRQCNYLIVGWVTVRFLYRSHREKRTLAVFY